MTMVPSHGEVPKGPVAFSSKTKVILTTIVQGLGLDASACSLVMLDKLLATSSRALCGVTLTHMKFCNSQHTYH